MEFVKEVITIFLVLSFGLATAWAVASVGSGSIDRFGFSGFMVTLIVGGWVLAAAFASLVLEALCHGDKQ